MQTLGSSTIYRLCEEVIALREMNNRQHKVFDQTLAKGFVELWGLPSRIAAVRDEKLRQVTSE